MTHRTVDVVRAELGRVNRAKVIADHMGNDWAKYFAVKLIATLRAELTAIERTQDERAG